MSVQTIKKVLGEVYGPLTSPSQWKPKRFGRTHGRYLWTDAFGVCNLISLYHVTKDKQFLEFADVLINDVHDVLGKDRAGRARLGNATNERPTLGGLRIGKEKEEGMDDGDGQYFHYLTKWMFALNRMTIATQQSKYNSWALDLAKSVHKNFVVKNLNGQLRMYWKISIDMSRPHTLSEGNLDPFDGYVTYRILQETAGTDELKDLISDMQKMVAARSNRRRDMYDPLDAGEALWICHWYPNEEWSVKLSRDAAKGIDVLYQMGEFDKIQEFRLAFREFGTVIGVKCFPSRMDEAWQQRADALLHQWDHQLYTRDKDITPVMYCSALMPGVWRNLSGVPFD